MLLSVLAKAAAQEVKEIRGECEILDLVMDSRKKSEKGLFFCIPGARFDAHDFAPKAIENGAAALVVTHFLPIDVPQVQVENVRTAMSLMAAEFYGHPDREMKLLGVTGTKGKTTTSFLIKAILEEAGYKVGLIGTTGNMIGDEYLESHFTTPEPIEFFKLLRQMRDAGVHAVSMEVSAHALHMNRLLGVHFESGCYTNLSQDHLDLFGTMEKYFACKKTFFAPCWLDNAAINVDDETSAEILRDITVPRTTYGICNNADLFARNIEITENGVHFTMKLFNTHEYPAELKLTGMFNVYNALAAAAVCLNIGVNPEVITAALAKVKSVPGRAEILDTHTPYKVLLDYSHSPDALENILSAVREFAKGRVISVFGCGGDRDALKRPVMGEISGRMADYSILTSDNPRTEDPFEILKAVEAGIKPTGGQYIVIENRREAIRHALQIGQDGDIIVLAGKGHETYQEIMGVKHPFDEKVVVRELLEELDQ
ncbi:MAG: UDP-N-acetylmuramoyl-L-alanyl-D-glutamate--2,6-diaminopimelate ligase [Clostridia bacterium]|nr:UDP-N-acetylmuramoyl-L-alanyl-D-glutamate--2,6-diaminopimelate ligase [Clostridiales bacterium]MBQ2976106.1 UDP-N-acetylmuramoyl-L-alanyl-D-glutamate--2,6-diaminopimelate ligase [Clostridia bacterium]MBQ6805329.1 UDP-N-acetylmuramoyl-L-alanyl-D-glutamate--2,6-diaminopimelate ligase [Clostridia bacterium]